MQACYNNNGYGPTFGGGHDFYSKYLLIFSIQIFNF